MSLAIREYDNRPGRDDFELAKLNFHQGNFAPAVKGIEADIRKRGESESKLFWLAMSTCASPRRKRSSAQDRGSHAGHHDARSPRPTVQSLLAARHRLQGQARGHGRRARTFKKLLDEYDRDNRLYRWLLNFCYMTTDRFPSGVPREYLVEGDFIDSFYGAKKREAEARFSHLSFRDRAKELGVDTLDAGKGVAVDDFDLDGDLDIVTGGTFSGLCSTAQRVGPRLHRAREGGGPSARPRRLHDLGGRLRQRRLGGHLRRPPSSASSSTATNGGRHLLRRDHRGGPLPGEPGETRPSHLRLTWADVNTRRLPRPSPRARRHGLPLVGGHARAAGRWVQIFSTSAGASPTARRNTASAPSSTTWSHRRGLRRYDSDGWPDLFVSSVSRDAQRPFAQRRRQALRADEPRQPEEPGFTTAFVDVNPDGRLESSRQSGLRRRRPRPARLPATTRPATTTGFFAGRRRLPDAPRLFGGGMSVGTMGSSYGDITKDGCADFYSARSRPRGWNILPETDVRRRRETREEVHGAADEHHDAARLRHRPEGSRHRLLRLRRRRRDEDIIPSLGGMWPGDEWPNQLFVNESKIVGRVAQGASARQADEPLRRRRADQSPRPKTTEGAEIVRHTRWYQKTGFGSAPFVARSRLMGRRASASSGLLAARTRRAATRASSRRRTARRGAGHAPGKGAGVERLRALIERAFSSVPTEESYPSGRSGRVPIHTRDLLP